MSAKTYEFSHPLILRSLQILADSSLSREELEKKHGIGVAQIQRSLRVASAPLSLLERCDKVKIDGKRLSFILLARIIGLRKSIKNASDENSDSSTSFDYSRSELVLDKIESEVLTSTHQLRSFLRTLAQAEKHTRSELAVEDLRADIQRELDSKYRKLESKLKTEYQKKLEKLEQKPQLTKDKAHKNFLKKCIEVELLSQLLSDDLFYLLTAQERQELILRCQSLVPLLITLTGRCGTPGTHPDDSSVKTIISSNGGR